MCQTCGTNEVVWLPTLGGPDCGCDTGCNSCNDCGSSCGGCNCPNITGSECIKIDKTNPNNWVISTECNPIVKSTDGTVTVTPSTVGNHKEYDLSVACQDRKVSVSPDCTAGFLEDQISVTGALTKSTVGCKVQLGLDEEKLALIDKDEKVKVNASCTSKYLDDAIKVGDGLKKEVVGCDLHINIDCGTEDDCNNKWRKPAMQLRVRDTVIISQDRNVDAYYVLAGTNAGGSSQVKTTEFIEEVKYGCIEQENGWIKIKKNGLYAIGFGGNQEVSELINGSRVGLLKYRMSDGTYKFVTESRYSGWSDGTSRPTNAWESNNDDITANGASGFNIGLGKYLERLPVGNSLICWLRDGDKIGLSVKLSTRVEDPSCTDLTGKFALLGQEEAYAGGDSGAYFYAYSISDNCMDIANVPDC